MADDENEKEHWEQVRVEHCPNPKCKGMLLQSDMSHYEKCSDCGKRWILNCNYEEVD